MLHISSLFRLDEFKKAFGYADDFAILEISPTHEENSSRKGTAIDHALTYGREKRLSFDPTKSELIYFSRKRKDKNNNPSVATSEFPIAVNQRRPYLK